MEGVVKIAGNLELLVLNFSFNFSTIRFFWLYCSSEIFIFLIRVDSIRAPLKLDQKEPTVMRSPVLLCCSPFLRG